MVAEGELRNNVDDSDRVRELQDKVVDLKAEVMFSFCYISANIHAYRHQEIFFFTLFSFLVIMGGKV